MNKPALILLLFLIVLKVAWVSTRPLLSDEYVHLMVARWLWDNKIIFTFDVISVMPTTIGAMTMPLLAWTTVFFHNALGIPIWILRYAFAIIFPLVTIYYLHKIFIKYDKDWILSISAMFVPVVFIWTTHAFYQEGLFVMFGVMTVYYYIKNRWIFIIPMILFMLTKFYLPEFIMLLLLYDSYQQKKYRKLVVAVIIAAVFFMVHQYVLSINFTAFGKVAPLIPELCCLPYIWNYGYTFVTRTLFMTGALPIIAMFFLMRDKRKHAFELIWFLSYFIFLVIGINEERRYIFSSLAVPVLIHIILEDAGKYRKLVFFIIMATFVISIMQLWDTYQMTPGLVESYPFLQSLPNDSIIFTPFTGEVSYNTGKLVNNQQFNLTKSNTTHLMIVKAWVKQGFWYNFITPNVSSLEAMGWTSVYDCQEIRILRRP